MNTKNLFARQKLFLKTILNDQFAVNRAEIVWNLTAEEHSERILKTVIEAAFHFLFASAKVALEKIFPLFLFFKG